MESLEVTSTPSVSLILRCMAICEELCDVVRGRLPPQRGKAQSRLSGRIGKKIIVDANGDVRSTRKGISD
eukprot:1327421-Amphidinium_carterae.4